MPLYKRKPFSLASPPENLHPDESVFQIRFTQEIFRDYEEYLKCLNLYRERVWTCKVTGKTNLTYEEALVSEQHATEKVQQFPKVLVAPVLRMIQYSTLGLKVLVNVIHSKLQELVLEGMELQGKKQQSVCACTILEILQDGDTIQYKVGWIDKNKNVTDISIINNEDLVCKRPPVSRFVLKAFIRESTSRSTPWVVHEELAKKYGILTEPPKELRDKLSDGNGYLENSKKDAQSIKVNKKRKENYTENGNLVGADALHKKTKREDGKPIELPVKYPIDDLLLQPAVDDPTFTDRPCLSTDFSVPMECVGDLLMAWNFCTSFGRLLNLWPFSLEDFENALCHKESNAVLISESHSVILSFLIKDEGAYSVAIRKRNRKAKISLTNWAEYLCDFLELHERSELSSHVSTIKRGHYGLLDISVKLSILRELVTEALTTDAIRVELDECMDRQQVLEATKREKRREKKEEPHPEKEGSENKEMSKENILENGKENIDDSNGMLGHHEDAPEDGSGKVYSSKTNLVTDNGESAMNDRVEKEGYSEKKNLSGVEETIKGRKRGKDKDTMNLKNPEELNAHLEREIEKLAIRVNSLGKDRNYNRYWFFRRDGRLFVESSDSRQWGYYAAKEELDALMGSLNPKGERERALHRQLVKFYQRISAAMQKRRKGVAIRILREEAELRRSTRVQAIQRDSPAQSFLKYVNKWKE